MRNEKLGMRVERSFGSLFYIWYFVFKIFFVILQVNCQMLGNKFCVSIILTK